MKEGAGKPAELLQQPRQALMVAVARVVVVEVAKHGWILDLFQGNCTEDL